MIVNTNINALIAGNALYAASAAVAKSSERISTGLRVNSAKDDPAGLGMANRFKAQVAAYSKATDNINLGIAAVQTADGALTEIATLLTTMRTVALSSSSGSTSAATRTYNQTLLESYRDEIDTIANSATFNGVSLLNGDTTTIAVQSGSDAGDTSSLSFSSVLSSALGTGSPLALTSLGSSTTALGTSDLTINGYAIGASSSSNDTSSYAFQSGSAIAKAAAINAKTSDTNVEADVGTTTASGSSMSVVGADTTGTITINGTAISLTLYATNDVDTNRAAVVTAINNNSGTTGITATNSYSATQGVILTAADGRNITVSHTTLSAASTGLAADGTYVGTYTLRSLDQSSIIIASQVGGTIANADLAPGTYSSNVAQMSSKLRSGSIAAPDVLAEGDLLINGYSIGATFTSDDTATVATTTSSTKKSSAIAMAAAINRQTSLTGVTAAVNSNQVVGTGFSAGDVDTIYLNGQTITASLSSTSSASDVVTLLNTYTGQTGVTATDNGSGVTLTASDGRNISIGVSSGGAAVAGTRIGLGGNAALAGAAATTAGAMTYISTVKLYASATFTVAGGTNGATNFAALGFRAGTYGGSADDTKISELDISTQVGGSNALTTIDDAIDMVSSYQAITGAQESRMDIQIDYVASAGVAATSAYGNIMDYNLAAETSALAAAEILQSGATAMLAQANVSADIVAYLLKKYTS